jgi:hypothetical protein
MRQFRALVIGLEDGTVSQCDGIEHEGHCQNQTGPLGVKTGQYQTALRLKERTLERGENENCKAPINGGLTSDRTYRVLLGNGLPSPKTDHGRYFARFTGLSAFVCFAGFTTAASTMRWGGCWPGIALTN